VEGIGLIDFSWFFGKLDSQAPMLIDKAAAGSHQMLIDEFEVLHAGGGRTPAAAATPTPKSTTLDSFDRGFLQWVTLGGMKLQPALPGQNPLQQHAMLATYQQKGDKFGVLFKRLGQVDLTGVTRLAFDVASERDATLILSVEVSKPGSAQGPRYQFTVYPPKDKEVFHVNVKLADFEHDDSSLADTEDKLNPAKIKTISLADISALTGGGAADLGPNRLWIGKLEALRQ
jgi:hypothetical protein